MSCNNAASGFDISSTSILHCSICGDSHHVLQCRKFRQLSVNERVSFTISNRLCFRCLNSGHTAKQCRTTYLCEVSGCGKPHSKFLHMQIPEANATLPPPDHGNVNVQDVAKPTASPS